MQADSYQLKEAWKRLLLQCLKFLFMALLHNRIAHKELKEQLLSEGETRITISFYKYFSIQNPLEFRDMLYKQLHAQKVFGRIYVANEGINAQVSVPAKQYENF